MAGEGSDLRLIVYTATPGSRDADTLALLGAVGLQSFAQQGRDAGDFAFWPSRVGLDLALHSETADQRLLMAFALGGEQSLATRTPTHLPRTAIQEQSGLG